MSASLRQPWNAVTAAWGRWGLGAKSPPPAESECSAAACRPTAVATDAVISQDGGDLLVRRMRALHIDPDQPASEVFAFGELTRVCRQCRTRAQCERELDDEFADPGWQAWRDYCPNATALSMLTALHGCETLRASQRGQA
jgi:hypothetical protein